MKPPHVFKLRRAVAMAAVPPNLPPSAPGRQHLFMVEADGFMGTWAQCVAHEQELAMEGYPAESQSATAPLVDVLVSFFSGLTSGFGKQHSVRSGVGKAPSLAVEAQGPALQL